MTTRADPPRDLSYMRREGILKHTVYCETCYKGGKYFVTGSEDINADVRLVNNPDITDHEKTFEPYFNESGDETFYKFVDSKEEVKRHAEKCDPVLRNRKKSRDRRNLKKFDYSKTKDYPIFKLEMSFDNFEKNKDFVYDLLGKETNMT